MSLYQVENVLYKLHSTLLETASLTLQEMFQMPSDPNSAEGTSDKNPICLCFLVTVKKLDSLLSWFYSP
jgi:hypothetical protein